MPQLNKPPVLFVHGLWMHAESWSAWVDFFRARGYEARALSWPGDSPTTTASRQNPQSIANRSVAEIADHLAAQIPKDQKPILIGHSFGGLFVQNLLGRDLAAAAIAIDPAPIQGVWQLPISALRAAFPVLGNPLNLTRSVMLTEAEFRYGFGNAVSETESKELYHRYVIPAPGRPLFQAVTANLNPVAETRVNTTNATRGPLLLISGERDHIVPPVLVRSTLNRYKRSPALTEFKMFANRGHSLAIDSGWKELADYSTTWLASKGF